MGGHAVAFSQSAGLHGYEPTPASAPFIFHPGAVGCRCNSSFQEIFSQLESAEIMRMIDYNENDEQRECRPESCPASCGRTTYSRPHLINQLV
jgi:hypothetical protein